MTGPRQLLGGARRVRCSRPTGSSRGRRRAIQISAALSTEPGRTVEADAFGGPVQTARDMADARFEVLGAPYSLLSVTLSASQKLFTRRGTLVAVAGQVDHLLGKAQSTLSLLNPLTRAPLGVPFLYQKISATSPITTLISTKSPTTSFTVLHLDGTTDWLVSQRNALLAWTGHTLSPSSRIQKRLSLAYWGSTYLTGRGLAALSGPGQAYKVTLAEGEEFVAHPGSVMAYSIGRNAPQPFRFASTSMRLQVPALSSWLPETEFIRTMRKTDTYKFLTRAWARLRTMMRRSIWGDRLFLQFRGPTTLLLSSRGVRATEVLSREQVDEIAEAPPGVLRSALQLDQARPGRAEQDPPGGEGGQAPSALHVASVRRDGKVTFTDAKDLKEFIN